MNIKQIPHKVLRFTQALLWLPLIFITAALLDVPEKITNTELVAQLVLLIAAIVIILLLFGISWLLQKR
jgi:hypothetical protein